MFLTMSVCMLVNGQKAERDEDYNMHTESLTKTLKEEWKDCVTGRRYRNVGGRVEGGGRNRKHKT